MSSLYIHSNHDFQPVKERKVAKYHDRSRGRGGGGSTKSLKGERSGANVFSTAVLIGGTVNTEISIANPK